MLFENLTWILFLVLLIVVVPVYIGQKWAQPAEGSRRTRHIDNNVPLGPNVGVKSIQGSRAYMEDTYQVCENLTDSENLAQRISMYGVFDGHGGNRASDFVSSELPGLLRDHPEIHSHPDRALVAAFERADEMWLDRANQQGLDDGSTAIVALVVGRMLYLANLGDCRAVLSQDGGPEGGRAIDLSHDHKPIRADEKARIEALGGRIKFHGTWRVEGALAVTRAFGDRRYKRFLTATPEVTCHRLTDQDHFLILASDGLWDVLTSQDAVDQVLVGHSSKQSSKELCMGGAKHLTNTAYKAGSMDNITTMVVDLRAHYKSACSNDPQLKGFSRRRALNGDDSDESPYDLTRVLFG